MDPHWFQCVSGSSFLSRCGSGSASREPNQFGSMRIRIRILVDSTVEFLQKNIPKVAKVKKTSYYIRRYKQLQDDLCTTKAVLKGRKPGLFVNFGQFQCSWIRIRIRIPNTGSESWTLDSQMNADPDLDPQPSFLQDISFHNDVKTSGCPYSSY